MQASSVARIGIIGAGMAGLSCATRLVEHGYAVQLFDKGNRPGGRMSTRRVKSAAGDIYFDHGAQYFTVRDPGFAAVVADWQQHGIVERWPPAGADAWVGQPAMNVIIGHMARAHDVQFGTLVTGISRGADGWRIMTHDGSHGPYDAVVVAIPSEQAVPLLALSDLTLAQHAMHARSQPCWTVMVGFAEPVHHAADVMRGRDIVSWVARNSAKPGRDPAEAWVIQATGQWSAEHIDDDEAMVLDALLRCFAAQVASPLPPVVATSVHRWRFALSAGTGLGALWNAQIGLGCCGDWLLGPRVECAWLSGQALADKIRETTALAVAAPDDAVRAPLSRNVRAA